MTSFFPSFLVSPLNALEVLDISYTPAARLYLLLSPLLEHSVALSKRSRRPLFSILRERPAQAQAVHILTNTAKRGWATPMSPHYHGRPCPAQPGLRSRH
ncbi:hypothetical protein GGR50DRAFT_655697 [Xylaria sp. CBS 124048]|nr:hypothetical protein GGR50DRAFT_655697 [Xylaria sp. CBS 124048]